MFAKASRSDLTSWHLIPTAISLAVVTLLYLLVTVATIGNIPWQQLGDSSASVGDVAKRIIAPGLANLIALVALAAAASPINALLLSYSRDIMVLANARVFPAVLGRVSRSHGVPYNGLLCIVLGAALIVPFGGHLAAIATLSTLSILVLQIALGLVVVRLPSESKALFGQKKSRLDLFGRLFFGIGLIGMSALFLIVAAWEKPHLFVIATGLLGLGAAYYRFRKHYLKQTGIDLDQSALQIQWS